MPDFFELYQIKPTFHPAPEAVRQEYLRIQREWHPDFFVGNDEKYLEALQKSAENNEAYKSLQNFISIVDYVLRTYNLLEEGEKNLLPPAFLSDMLDLNDLIGDAAMGDSIAKANADKMLTDYERSNELAMQTESIKLEMLDDWNAEVMGTLKTLYQQHRYLARLRRNLSEIA
ncbi:MAG: hypothetical protein KG003_04900 [Bacteroidetes bacterium]|nr:hypothetical protein [Bacteroidota bacterium]